VQVRLGRADFLGTAQSQTASPALPARLNPAAQAVTSTIAFASTSLRPSQAPRRRALRRERRRQRGSESDPQRREVRHPLRQVARAAEATV